MQTISVASPLTPERAKQYALDYTYDGDTVNPRRHIAISNDINSYDETPNLGYIIDAFINIGWEIKQVLQTSIVRGNAISILTTYILTRESIIARLEDVPHW